MHMIGTESPDREGVRRSAFGQGLSFVLSSSLSSSVSFNFVNGHVLLTNLDSHFIGAALFNLMAETSSERAANYVA